MLNSLTELLYQKLLMGSVFEGKLLIAVSGGSDSTALLHVAKNVCDRHPEFSLIVGHFNHRWRSESSRDVAFVTDRAASLGIECHVGEADNAGTTSEEQARKERYRFLEDLTIQRNCRAILTAHTLDDQAETVLHHLLRGSSMAGIAGIPEIRNLEPGLTLVRPWLEVERSTLRQFLSEINLTWREDPSNASSEFTRNRLRHELLPLLEGMGYSDAKQKLAQLAEQARAIHVILSDKASILLDRSLLEQQPTVCRLAVDGLRESELHLIREVFVELWKRNGWPRQKMGFREWDQLANLVKECGSVSLPGKVIASRIDRVLVLERSP